MEIDRRIDAAQEAALHKAYVQLPNTQVTVIKPRLRDPEGPAASAKQASPASAIWVGTREGAIRLSRDYRARGVFRRQALAA